MASNEIFFNYNSLSIGPQAGFNQARLYYGVFRKINEDLSVEFGYMFNPIGNEYPSHNLIRHNIILTLNANFDRKRATYTPDNP